MDETLKLALRWAGAAVNAALAILFLYVAVRLYGYGSSRLAEAGGLGWPGSMDDPAALANLAVAFVLSPDALSRAAGYAAAWFSLIAAMGCAWMAVLGGRWLYNAVARSA